MAILFSSIRDRCCSLRFLFLLLPICFAACIILAAVPALTVQSMASISALVLIRQQDVAGKLHASLDAEFAPAVLTLSFQTLYLHGHVDLEDLNGTFAILVSLAQPWPQLRYLEHADTEGRWNAVERYPDGTLWRVVHRHDGSMVYDYYEVDNVTLQPIPGTDTPATEDGRTCACCGYPAFMDYLNQHNLTLGQESDAGVVAWGEPQPWQSDYLMVCTRPLFHPATGEFQGVISAYFEFAQMRTTLQQVVQTPSEKLFLIQPGKVHTILSTSDMSISLLRQEANGSYTAIPFVDACPEGAVLAPLIDQISGERTISIGGQSCFVFFSDYVLSENVRFILIHLVGVEDYLGDVHRGFAVVGAVIGAICVGLVVASVVLARVITAPLSDLLHHLDDIMNLNLQAVSVTTNITEIRRIYNALGIMVSRMAEYKAYMPDMELMRNKAPSEESDDISEPVNNPPLPPASSICPDHAKPELLPSYGQDSSPHSSEEDAPVGVGRPRGKLARGAGLRATFRTISVVSIDIAQFHAITTSDAILASTVFEKVLELVAFEVKCTQGTLLRFYGGNFVAVWNTTTPHRSHHSSALEAALTIADRLRVVLAAEERLLAPYGLPLRVGIGVAGGAALCGSMGTALNRTFNVIGPACNLASYLAKLCAKYEVPLLVDKVVADGMQFSSFQVVPLDVVLFPKMKPREGCAGHVIHVVGPKGNAGAEEWMYTLQRMRTDVHQIATGAFQSFLNGNVLGAKEMLLQMEDEANLPAHLEQVKAHLLSICDLALKEELDPRSYVANPALVVY